jgi:hypothetical protein
LTYIVGTDYGSLAVVFTEQNTLTTRGIYMKRIAIKVAGSESDPIDRTIKPGTTAGEILADIGLAGYLLSSGPTSNRFFAEDENVYIQVGDGDKLYATTPADVGI